MKINDFMAWFHVSIPSLRPKVYSSGAAIHKFLHFHAHCLLHFSWSQLRMHIALENPLALNNQLFAVNFARLF